MNIRCDGGPCGYNAAQKRPPQHPDPVDIQLRPGLDPKYVSGDCRKCKKTVICSVAELERHARAQKHTGGPN